MGVQEPVQAAIWHALNHYAYRDAEFLSERLYAEVGSDEALFLLATCYYRAGKATKAYRLLEAKGCPSAQCKFLMARCCCDIEKLAECENMLSGSQFSKTRSMDDISTEFGESASYAFALLGNVYSKTERITKSCEHYKRSLKQNPFLWSAFEALCQQGEQVDPCRIFQNGTNSTSSQMLHSLNTSSTSSPFAPNINIVTPNVNVIDTSITQIHSNMNTPANSCTQPSTPIIDGDTYHTPDNPIPMCPPSAPKTRTTRKHLTSKDLDPCSSAKNSGRTVIPANPLPFSPLTPSFGIMPLEATPSPGQAQKPVIFPSKDIFSEMFGTQDIIKAPKKPMSRRTISSLSVKPPVFSQSGNTRDMRTPSPQIQNNPPVVRRSSRLYRSESTNSAVKENAKNQKTFASPKAPVKHMKSSQVHAIWQKQSVEGLMTLLQDIGKAYVAQCQYEGDKALTLYSEVNPRHQNSAWVQCQIAKIHFVMANYKECVQVFEGVCNKEPYRLEDMEVYSTALWHLQREVQLSALAQRLTDLDRLSVHSCCVTGNCFSLQKEHNIAVKYFQRATQLDPNFAYAYTLLGHEFVLTEELDKAMSCFRSAVRVDVRHYNAWYGIGMIYYKQEKLALAEVHFRKALLINPQSSVLMCHIGVVQHALKKSNQALSTFSHAISKDPKNALCKFHRTNVLFDLDRHQESLTELEELKRLVPKESLVYFLIGKVHKKLGNTHLALMHFSWAMDLDPKGANNKIKESLDKRYVTDEDDPINEINVSSGLDDSEHLGNSSLDEDDHQMLQAESDESL